MKLFIIPSGYPDKDKRDSASFVYEQSLALTKCGYEIVVLDASTYDYHHWNDRGCSVAERSKDEVGIRYTLHTRGMMTSRLPRLATWCYTRKIRKLFYQAISDNGKPDAIIAHFSLPAGFAAIELAEKEKIPCIIIEHYSLFLNEQIHQYTQKQLFVAVQKSSAFICVSNSLKKMIEKHTGISEKVSVIPNMVHSRFAYSSLPNQKPFVFFSAGNLNANKRFDLLIEAFCQAFTLDDHVILKIAGKGEDYQKLEQLIQEYNRSEQITLLGWVSREDMVFEYQKCHCFTLLSRHETFGIVYREAMAIGRPVIATKNGGIEENWKSENGILLEKDDLFTISEALLKIYKHWSDYDLSAISERCLNLYSEEKVVHKLENILNGVCNEGN